jgi:hypothetical protein
MEPNEPLPEPEFVTSTDETMDEGDQNMEGETSEAVPADDQAQPIDPESMYDRRPEEDKDSPPSEGVRQE